jgi:hypothetical protein
MGSSHTKAFLLLQAHFERAALPIADYINDTKSVLDQVSAKVSRRGIWSVESRCSV